MNTTISEKTEQLLREKNFDALSTSERETVTSEMSEQDYRLMRTLHQRLKPQASVEISPSPELKNKLDRRWASRRSGKRIMQLRIPVYQSVAAAILLFFVGFHFNYRKAEPEVVTQKVAVLKYVDRPVKEIRYVPLRQESTEPVDNTRVDHDVIPTQQMADTNAGKSESFDAHSNTMQDMANNNLQQNVPETVGVSMGSDTVLRNMMVTVY